MLFSSHCRFNRLTCLQATLRNVSLFDELADQAGYLQFLQFWSACLLSKSRSAKARALHGGCVKGMAGKLHVQGPHRQASDKDKNIYI